MRDINLILLSLQKSYIRFRILKYLWKIYPERVYAKELADKMLVDATNVMLAVESKSKRYSQILSLSNLELVNIQKVEHYTFYQLSDYGVDVCKDIFNSKSKHYMSYPLDKNKGD